MIPRTPAGIARLLLLVGGLASLLGSWILAAPLANELAPTPWLAWWVHGSRRTFSLLAVTLSSTLAVGWTAGTFVAYSSQTMQLALRRLQELSTSLPPVVVVALVRVGSPDSGLSGFLIPVAILKGLGLANTVLELTLRLRQQHRTRTAEALGSSVRKVYEQHIGGDVTAALARQIPALCLQVLLLEGALSFIGLSLGGPLTWPGHLGSALHLIPLLTPATYLALGSTIGLLVALRLSLEPIFPEEPIGNNAG